MRRGYVHAHAVGLCATPHKCYKEITGYPTTYLINRRGEIERYMPVALSREIGERRPVRRCEWHG